MNIQQQIQRETAERLEQSKAQRMEVANDYLAGRYLRLTDVSKTIDRLNHKGERAQAARLSQIQQQIVGAAKRTKPESLAEDPKVEEANRIVLETLVGRNDMLPIQFLHQGSQRARCVGRIVTLPLFAANGTGFMISPRLMMTNHHVISSEADAKDQVVQFGVGDSSDGAPITFRFRPAEFFVKSEADELDCTIVAVEAENADGIQLSDFGWVTIGDEGAVQIGERVNLIHHPGGEPKQVSIRDNFVAGEVPQLDPKYWLYASDTRRGSSGSPVFNEEWEVVALHHAAVEISDPDEVEIYSRILQSHGVTGLATDDKRIELNEGIRMPLILDWLRQEEADFTAEELALYEQFLDGPVFERKSKLPHLTSDGNRSSLRVANRSGDDKGVYSIPMTFNFHLGPQGLRQDREMRGGRRRTDAERTLELFKDEVDSQKSVFTALSYLQTHREGEYLPSEHALAEHQRDYYGSLIAAVAQDQISPDDLYDELHALSSSRLEIVGRFPESMRSLDDLVVPQSERGLESMRILEGGAAYARARAHLYTWVDLQPHRMLQCPYTDALIAPEQILLNDLIKEIGQKDLLPQRFRNNRYLNCEHIVPQSWFKEDFPDGVSDLHHLISADGGANNFRSDCPYRVLGSSGELGPENNPGYIPKAGQKDGNFFEPAKGKHVVARATLYFLITYKGALDATKYGPADIAVLKEWAKATPPGDYEQHRNQTAFEAQGNRNPLIDFPDWIDQINFERALA